MRHQVKGSRKFGRDSGERRAMLKNLMVSLIEHEQMRTTAAKAAEIRPMVEQLISLSTEDTPHHRQVVEARLGNRVAVAKLFDDIGPRLAGRPGGYTQIFKLDRRQGDGAEIVLIRIVE